MIATALVSGSLRRALFRDADGLWILAEGLAEPNAAGPADVSTFLHIAREVAQADPAGLPLSIDQVRARLLEEIDFFDGLDGLLVGMDPDFSDSVREEGVRNSNSILARNGPVARRVLARFLIPTNSQEWDPIGGKALAERIGAREAVAAYQPLTDGTVEWIVADLDQQVVAQLGRGAEAETRRSALLTAGIVAELCAAMQDRTTLLALPFRLHELPGIQAADPGGKILTNLVKHLAGPAIEKHESAVSDVDGSNLDPMSGEPDPLNTAVIDAAIIQAQRKRKGYRSKDHDLDAIQREIAWIGDRLRIGEINRAEQAILHLIAEQATRSEPIHIVKTLTQIADRARGVREFDFAMRLLDAADFFDARDAAAMCLRGEVLRELGRPEEALAVFRETRDRFPYDVVPPTAYAETLRDLGRSEEALAVFRETMDRFPHDEVPRNCCANLLLTEGRFTEGEALLEMQVQRLERRNDWIALHIVAMGHLRRKSTLMASKMLRHGLENCPFVDVARYFRNALALALIMERKAADALAELEPAVQQTTSQNQKATIRLVRAHALGECGEKNATREEVASVQAQFVLTAKQRELADLLLAKYVQMPHSLDSSAQVAANDNIYRVEFELMSALSTRQSASLRLAA